MSHENDEWEEPTDKLKIGVQILSVEEETEYVEDPQNIMAWGEIGKPFKAKVKVVVSYNRSEL